MLHALTSLWTHFKSGLLIRGSFPSFHSLIHFSAVPPSHMMDETLLLIRVSHPSPKVNCSVVSAPSASELLVLTVFSSPQCSVKCAERKLPASSQGQGHLSSFLCQCLSALFPGMQMISLGSEGLFFPKALPKEKVPTLLF